MKARKRHECCCCGYPIFEGMEYIRESIAPWMMEDGEGFYEWKSHNECRRLFYKSDLCEIGIPAEIGELTSFRRNYLGQRL